MPRPATLVFALCCFILPAAAEDAALRQCGLSTGLSLDIRDVRVVASYNDHVEMEAQIEASSRNAAELRDVNFSSVRIDGDTPAFVHPIAMNISLRAGQTMPLPPVRLDMYYADLPSPRRLDEILHRDSVRLTGEVSAGLKVSVLDRLLLGAAHPTAEMVLDQSAHLTSGAVPSSVNAGVGVMDILQRTSEIAGDIVGVNADTVWERSMDTQEREWARSLVLITTTYRDDTAGGTTKVSERIGFWIGPHTVLAPDEAVRPWLYDGAAIAVATNCERSEKVDGVEVTIRPVLRQNQTHRWSMTDSDFHIEAEGDPETEKVVVSSTARNVPLSHRNSPQNWVRLRFNDSVPGTPLPLLHNMDALDETRAFHLFRRRKSGADGESIEPLEVTGQASGEQVNLNRPLDNFIFGSPVISRGSVVGIVTGERSVLWADDRMRSESAGD